MGDDELTLSCYVSLYLIYNKTARMEQ